MTCSDGQRRGLVFGENEPNAVLEEMGQCQLVGLSTVAKVMRWFAGAGQWEEAVTTFYELGTLGLEKNTESMNLLLDTREVFLELKPHISANDHMFNIYIHGWCKMNWVDEAHWTIQETRGNRCLPCVTSYSTIIQFYCQQYKISKGLLNEMQAQGCPPNIVTFTTIMCSLTKVGGV
jgi:pentatricopeptide repeat protein